MIKTILAPFGSVVAALLASSCCIGPLALIFFGVGGVTAGAGFEAYRPYMLIVSALFLGTAFYREYRPKEDCCTIELKPPEGLGKLHKVRRSFLWLSAVIAFIFMLIPQILSFL